MHHLHPNRSTGDALDAVWHALPNIPADTGAEPKRDASQAATLGALMHIANLASGGWARQQQFLAESLAQAPIGIGSTYNGYRHGAYPGLVLRALRNAVERNKPLPILEKRLIFIAVRYPEEYVHLLHFRTLGLPLAIFVPDDHEFAGRARRGVLPEEALFDLLHLDDPGVIPFMLLSDCSGVCPLEAIDGLRAFYASPTKKRRGRSGHSDLDHDRWEMWRYLGLEIERRHHEQLRTDIEALHAGTFRYPADAPYKADLMPDLQSQHRFAADHLRIVNELIAFFTALNALPQRTFDEALATLHALDLLHQKVRLDYSHSFNMRVDFERGVFSFFDLRFDLSMRPASRAGDLDNFLRSLLGLGVLYRPEPYEWFVRKGDIARFRPLLQGVVDKIAAGARSTALCWGTSSPNEVDHIARRFDLTLPKRRLLLR